MNELNLTDFDILYLRCLLGGTSITAMEEGVVDPSTLRYAIKTPEQEEELRKHINHHGALYTKFCQATGT